MTMKKTPPSFIEGWERIPGASNYEINAQGEARNFLSKKKVKQEPDAEGNVQIYGDEKKLEKFNLKLIAAQLFNNTSTSEQIMEDAEKGESQTKNQPINSETMSTKTANSKKPSKKGSTPSKAETPKAGAKVATIEEKPHAKAKNETISKPISSSISEKAKLLKNGNIEELKKRIDVKEIISKEIKQKEKISALAKLNLNNKQISELCGTNQGHVWNVLNSEKKK